MARESLYKKCPRCGEKTFRNAKTCENCKLIFSRLEYSSNKEAKVAIRKGEREKVIYSTQFPSDLNRWKVFIICALGGSLGLHNIIVGKYIKGFFSFFITMLTAILILVLNGTVFANLYSSFMFIPAGMVFIFWFYDLFLIGINKFKVPIALNMPAREPENGK